MPAKIRLQRFGKKGFAYYHIVVADARAPRDGKFIEKIGSYNPNTNPATIDINREKALQWLKDGAQPTDTLRAILAYKGVLFKHHLEKGVKKGALSQEQADAKFEQWEAEKLTKVSSKSGNVAQQQRDAMKQRLADEGKVREAKAKALQEKMSALAAEAEAAAAAPEVPEAPAAPAAAEGEEAPAPAAE